MIRRFVWLVALCTLSLATDDPAQPSLTIYNQNFAVVRQELPLELKSGVNSVRVTDITMHLEPDSVILRDPTGKQFIQVLEQNYRADPLSESLLLSLFEGKTIDFLAPRENKQEIVPGKIIRSGYVPHSPIAMRQYGTQYYQAQMAQGGSEQPIVEVDGKVRFGLPGTPLFPALGNDTVLKPTLQWLLSTPNPGPLRAEFSYVTGGLTWEADYNIVAPEKGNAVDVVGWVTMDNQSGKRFQNARIKLMAGDVNKIQPEQMYDRVQVFTSAAPINGAETPPVTERTFDEYHLYTLARSTTLDDRETKQVEFIRAGNVSTTQIYIYDGLKLDPNRYNGWNWRTSAMTSRMVRNQTLRYGLCESSTTRKPTTWVCRCRKGGCGSTDAMTMGRLSSPGRT